MVLILIVLAGCVTENTTKEETLKIGAILPLSGPAAIFGESIVQGMEIALEDLAEEDIIIESKAKDIMDANPPVVYENMQLHDILKIFTEHDNLYYPVVNKQGKLCGAVTVEGIKYTLLETGIEGLILANDLMEPVVATVLSDASATQVKELLNKYDIEYLPVVDNDGKLQGFIEKKMLDKYVSTRMIELQKHLDTLEKK